MVNHVVKLKNEKVKRKMGGVIYLPGIEYVMDEKKIDHEIWADLGIVPTLAAAPIVPVAPVSPKGKGRKGV